MNLLEENNNYSKKENSPKKTVGNLLIFSIIALIIVIMLIAIMKVATPTSNKESTYTIFIDNVDTNIKVGSDSESIVYVPLEEFSQALNYTYYNGEYKGEATESKENCYVKNKNEIIGFSTQEKKIYKTSEDSIVEKQYYELSNEIVNSEDKIYVSIDDLAKIFKVKVEYKNEELKMNVTTVDGLIAENQEKLDENSTMTIDNTFPNAQLVMKNMLVVLKNNQYGVVDTDFKTIIGTKYKSIEYDEYTTDFIVSDDNNRYGVITDKGDSKISLKYDSLFIINYEPVLYAVTKNQQYGVIDEEGNTILDIGYDKLGCAGDERNNINDAFIIKDIKDDDDGIIVCKDSKYGIINLRTGDVILECVADKINSRTNDEGIEEYFATSGKNEEDLNEYIKNTNELRIDLSNTIINITY